MPGLDSGGSSHQAWSGQVYWSPLLTSGKTEERDQELMVHPTREIAPQ